MIKNPNQLARLYDPAARQQMLRNSERQLRRALIRSLGQSFGNDEND